VNPTHLKPHLSSPAALCGTTAPAALADVSRTYAGPDYCVDCAELWRAHQRDLGVNVAALDCARWEDSRRRVPSGEAVWWLALASY